MYKVTSYTGADSSQFHPATQQWNIAFPHRSYRFNIIASSDPNITTARHKRCTIYTGEENTPRYYIKKSGYSNSSLISQLTTLKTIIIPIIILLITFNHITYVILNSELYLFLIEYIYIYI